MNKMVKSSMRKKAVSPYVSWILIMAFVVVLSAFMYSFMTDYTEETTEDVKKQVYDADECRSVSVDVVSACNSSQALNITIQNTDYIRIDAIDFRLYDMAKKPVLTNRTDISMNPNRIKQVEIAKGGTEISMIEVVPIIFKENMEIICGEKKAQAEVKNCQ